MLENGSCNLMVLIHDMAINKKIFLISTHLLPNILNIRDNIRLNRCVCGGGGGGGTKLVFCFLKHLLQINQSARK